MSRKGRGQSCVRTVSYTYEGDFDEPVVEDFLIAARDAGIVTQFDTGRGHAVWFNGQPGEKLRAVREKVRELVAAGPKSRY